ncbi:hypothetical protein NDU88_004310 [Pleurodeles waltl]|uniref:Uncharacterized protein n=1 Tax=Pleurodeles waltl TaxID=8319 RepID=A0AAV7TQX8_PLEWA|nr:hypothetical protein NDU88_004310 [Pleurodeles waltl]
MELEPGRVPGASVFASLTSSIADEGRVCHMLAAPELKVVWDRSGNNATPRSLSGGLSLDKEVFLSRYNLRIIHNNEVTSNAFEGISSNAMAFPKMQSGERPVQVQHLIIANARAED